MNKFSCFKVKEIEKRDSVLTPKQQIDRLLRPGSTYFNLNPFEVLQLEPECPLDEIKKKYRRLSILVHPDKNMVSGYRKTVVLLVAVTLLVDLHSVSKSYYSGKQFEAMIFSTKWRKYYFGSKIAYISFFLYPNIG